ncbi:hypothetical protein SAMN05216241_101205 [Limimonas halophila]|uniref:Uncharacterized protein n=1 Tax=Limimonas halophila TaxID=1082479 RepID=A0A1G7LDC6_9PROT|nr:hypothetical protein [Limimonas halophila]SDF47386.1 hypothetical protein SAMN05216241_101205 [Limimonas halophila]
MRDQDVRLLLKLASQALAAGAAALGREPNRAGRNPNDERLFALEHTHAQYQTELDAWFAEHGTATEAMESLLHRQFAVLEAMQAIPADTLAGAAAKARVTTIHRKDLLRDNDAPSDLQADALDALVEAYGASEAAVDAGVQGIEAGRDPS